MSRPTFPLRPGCLRVGVLTTLRGLRQLERVKLPCDLVEVRIDHLLAAGCPATELVHALSVRRHPVLLTLRGAKEGGAVAMTDLQRAALLKELLPLGEALDWEFASRRAGSSLLASAKRHKVAVILSAHDFKSTPTAPALKRRLATMQRAKPAIVKLATCTDDPDALLRLLRAQSDHPGKIPLALMGMGALASESRQLLPLLGTRLVYGYLDAPSAPGQPHIRDVTGK